MDEPILDYVQRLERKVRFWRNTSLILAAFLISGLVATWTLARVQQQFVVGAMVREAVAKAEAERQTELARRFQAMAEAGQALKKD